MKIQGTVIAGIIGLVSSGAFAGSHPTEEVGSTYAGGITYVYGSFSSARYSADGTQYIGCYVSALIKKSTDTSTKNYIECEATDSSGNFYYCYDYTPPDAWIKIIAGMNPSSGISFGVDSHNHCMLVTDQPSSWNLP